MKRKIFCVAVVGLVLCSLTITLVAQDKPSEADQMGKKQPDGSVVMPEGAPPRGHDKQVVRGQFLIDIKSIDVKQTSAGPSFTMKGASEYPDGTMAAVALRFFEVTLPGTNRLVTVKNGGFQVTFSASKLWAGKRFFPGNYELEVVVKLDLQGRRAMKKIKDKLGVNASDGYRNKYVRIGKMEKMKEEEDRLREYYVNAVWGIEKLFKDFDTKYRAASVKYTKKFYKLDKNDKPQRDKNNKEVYEVDEKAFRKYLRNNPNEFYDRTGAFQEEVWRTWLDTVWRAEWKKVFDSHKRMKGNYAAIPWPKQYDELTTALKMLMKKSAENSIKVYKWHNLPMNKKDANLGGVVPGIDSWPVKVDERAIKRLIKSVRFKLKLDQYIERKKGTEKKDK